jgi:hypothetical protein
MRNDPCAARSAPVDAVSRLTLAELLDEPAVDPLCGAALLDELRAAIVRLIPPRLPPGQDAGDQTVGTVYTTR